MVWNSLSVLQIHGIVLLLISAPEKMSIFQGDWQKKRKKKKEINKNKNLKYKNGSSWSSIC